MRRALVLSVVLVAGCRQASAPPAVDEAAKKAAKTSKEISELLRKADSLAAANNTSNTPPVATASVAAVQPVPLPPAPSANPPVAPAASQHVAPAKSNAEVVRDQAAAAIGDRLRSLRRTAEAARLKKDRYLQACQGKGSLKPDCQVLTTDIADASKTIERELGD